MPPQANPDEVTIKPGETATLYPETELGNSNLVSVTFDNGETTKHVDGEGTWQIGLVDGKVVATFTPDDPAYKGKVTQQSYTVTDENGLTATSTLDVNIVEEVKPIPTNPGKSETPVATTTPDDGGNLAHTGAEGIVPISILAGLLLLAGGAAALIARRRSQH